MTALDLQTEYWAHYYADNKVQHESEDEDFDLDQVLSEMEAEAEAPDDWEEVDLNGE